MHLNLNNTNSTAQSGIGVASTTAVSGVAPTYTGMTTVIISADQIGRYRAVPAIGLQAFTALEKGSGSGTNTWAGGGQAGNEISARWMA